MTNVTANYSDGYSTDGKTIKILGIVGSIRANSNNKGLLRAAHEEAPEGVIIETFDVGQLPLYNQDLDANPPAIVVEWKRRVREADALLIASPEYNYSVSGVLKNALEWASRPPKESPLREKPVAIMGAGGVTGTARGQAHLRQILFGTRSRTMFEPELMVARSWEKFDAEGNLTDQSTREGVRGLVQALVEWTNQVNHELHDEALPYVVPQAPEAVVVH